MAQHTAGPWTLDGPTRDEDGWSGTGHEIDILANDCDSHPIATLHINTSCRDLEEWEANARILAAAPDLLDALENLIIAIGMGWDLEGMVDVARAAITKAEGKA